MCRKVNLLVLIFMGLSFVKLKAQENQVRFFDLETRPIISILYDQTYKRNINPSNIPVNIYDTSVQRKTIDMGMQARQKEAEINYITQIYQSRINQQQTRISQNYQTTKKPKSNTNQESGVFIRQPYNYNPYGWQNNYYHASGQWQPTFYQGTGYGRLRANRYLFY